MEIRRGWSMSVLALAVYGFVFLTVAFDYDGTVARSRRAPVRDSLLVMPLAFLALAYITSIDLWFCAVVSAALWVALLPLVLRRRRFASAG